MIERNRIHVLVLSLLSATALLSACSERTSRSHYAATSEPADSSDLPEIVVTAHALAAPVDDPDDETPKTSNGASAPVPASIGKAAEATARKARASSGASDETG
jgi:hypothetical protein